MNLLFFEPRCSPGVWSTHNSQFALSRSQSLVLLIKIMNGKKQFYFLSGGMAWCNLQ